MVDKVPGFAPQRISPAELENRRVEGSRTPKPAAGPSFAETLQSVGGSPSLRFSAHAQERLRSRDIELTDRDNAQLAQAIDIAQAKGAQESLILFDDLALIVSVRNRVVITALERGEQQANVFTNIDSAVVLPGNRS
jgi:flagellar operon protein